MRKRTRKARWWRPRALYGQQARAEHRAVASGHGQRPEYSRKMRRMITRLFR
jgi:hypothetical protein